MTNAEQRDGATARPWEEIQREFPVNKEWGHDKLEEVLIGAAGILDVVKGEWTESWSEWDTSVRNGLTQQIAQAHVTAVNDHSALVETLEALAKELKHVESEFKDDRTVQIPVEWIQAAGRDELLTHCAERILRALGDGR